MGTTTAREPLAVRFGATHLNCNVHLVFLRGLSRACGSEYVIISARNTVPQVSRRSLFMNSHTTIAPLAREEKRVQSVRKMPVRGNCDVGQRQQECFWFKHSSCVR